MTYDDLIISLSQIVDNEEIYKTGLVIEYKLNTINHRKMDEHLYYMGKNDGNFEHRDIIEVEIGGVLVRLIKDTPVD